MLNAGSARAALYVCLAAALLLQRAVAAVPADVIILASDIPSSAVVGDWALTADTTAAGGVKLRNPNRGAGKVSSSAAPVSYFEVTFDADAGVPYHLWMRMRADNNSYSNDSVYVWVNGAPTPLSVILEEGSGANVSGWGWNDQHYGGLAPHLTFATGGTQRLRVGVREDGVSIDQIVLSPSTYLTARPGALKNDATILDGGSAPPPATVTLVREPYLQQVTDTSATIVWASREPGPASARVGTATVAATTSFVPASTTGMAVDYFQHVATAGGLTPFTTYAYTLFVDGVAATPGTDRLTTAPAAGTGRVRFVAFGDSGIGSTAQRTISSLIEDDAFDLALHTGDIVYGASSTTGDASYGKYHEWYFDIYRNWLRRRPMFPSNGNHDSRSTNGWGRAYLDLFVLPENGADGAYPDHAERYYSFDYGPVHFVALDTERAFQDPARRAVQLAWLDDDLAATTQPWKIVFFHRPGYSAGGEHDADLAVRAAFGPILERHGVQLALTGHQHNFERTVPWRESTDLSRQAVTYYVTGGGGARLYASGRDARTAASGAVYHYLRGSVEGCVATIQTVDSRDVVIDSFSLDRCLQALDTAPPQVSVVSPADGALVSGTVTVEAGVSDDTRVEKVDLWIDGVLHDIDLTAPYRFTWNAAGASAGAHTLEVRAVDLDGKRSRHAIDVTVGAPAGSGGDIVVRAADVPAAAIVGDWAVTADSTAAGGVKLRNPNRGAGKVSASATPVSYFDVTFDAAAGVPYHLWMRMRADNNSYSNDSVYVWVNGAATPMSVILEEGSGAGVHGWGWNDQHWGGLAPHITFAGGGRQTLRIGVREDGVSIDQILLSPSTYLTTRPGALKDDSTLLP